MKGTGVCISEIPPPSLQRLQEIGALEVFGHIVVHTGDDLVDGLLPGLFRVFSGHQGFEELTEGLLYDEAEGFWSLELKKRVTNLKGLISIKNIWNIFLIEEIYVPICSTILLPSNYYEIKYF